jgi:carbamoyl-phosphate synthase large subunit
MPTLEAVDVCIDKWAFHQRTSADGLPVPLTALGGVSGVPGPWVIKPRFGRGSRDVVVTGNVVTLTAALGQVPEPLVQTQLDGREFTCDALVDRSGAVVGTSARWRTETRGGISTKGTTFDDPEVSNMVTQALKSVGLVGPANVQGFVAEDGTVSLIEINPRFSGGLPLSLAAGADLVEEYLRDIMGLPVRPERLVARAGVTMTRFFDEVFEG